MEFRDDLLFSVPQYGGKAQGLLTIGNFKEIKLDNGKSIELMPYLLQKHCTRGVSKDDPRRRMRDEDAIIQLAQPYADHYNNADLGEKWSKEEAHDMLFWQLHQSLGRFFLVKWVREVGTTNEFPVGFFCAYTKPYQGGKMIWDGELFVLPEYRKYGIGTELVEALFTVAQSSGVNFFEALTYEDENGYPLKFWQKLGIQCDDLIHITGNIDEMLSRTADNNSKREKHR